MAEVARCLTWCNAHRGLSSIFEGAGTKNYEKVVERGQGHREVPLHGK